MHGDASVHRDASSYFPFWKVVTVSLKRPFDRNAHPSPLHATLSSGALGFGGLGLDAEPSLTSG